MKVKRVEKHIIKNNHKAYKVFDNYCFKAKNIYNLANYTQRQIFIRGRQYLNMKILAKN